MRKAGPENIKTGTKKPTSIKTKDSHLNLISPVLIFILSFLYFYWFCDYVFFYQENFSLFVYSSQYFHEFAIKPGGLLDYAGSFLAQGFFNTLYGALILSSVFTMLVFACMRIGRKLSRSGTFTLFLVVIPSCLLLLIQTNFNWMLRNDIGFLLATVYFLFTMASDKKHRRIIGLLMFPAFYYLAGAFAWIFLGMQIVYTLLYIKGSQRFSYPLFLLTIAFATFILFKEVLFLQSPDALLLFPFSLRENFTDPAIIFLLIGLMIIYPALFKISSFLQIKGRHTKTIALSSMLAVLAVTTLLLSKFFNPNIKKLFQLEKFVYEQDWDALVEHQETYQLSNSVSQYYYNLALSEKGQLCDRMFYGRQDFGPNALIIPWDSKAGVNNIARGVYFYYAVGLINEAHRWAYESMVAQGYKPENLKILVKTDLINGYYKTAEKYIQILKKTLHYRNWAKKYEAMLYRPDLVMADHELGEKLKILPRKDFSIRIRNPQTNIPPLLEDNPNNKKAFEYMIAWFLLEKKIGALVNEVGRMKDMPYSSIPRHIEEALLIYNMATGMFPDLGGLRISEETIERYGQYQLYADPLLGIQPSARQDIQNSSRDTYWFYFEFK